ncbi:hypothetical protein Zm00014a_024659 [Zea mays]|uniref:Uncharacterized protein n=1 Tax=Zea mays TaxID=4577 RepID=A0A3L6GD10_MAIZE|nr:hypothetical protein Zm00014a_024659 [Zea mays]
MSGVARLVTYSSHA